MKHIPTEFEWRSVPWCLDIPYAYNHFSGKTVSEAVSLFEENAIKYQEDLMFMPVPCLSYYIHAYIEYLMSDQSKSDSDGAACFFDLIEIRHADIRSFTSKTVEQAISVLKRLGTRQRWYDAEPTIYGDFAKKAKQSIELLSQSR